jgi:hypothetical protein
MAGLLSSVLQKVVPDMHKDISWNFHPIIYVKEESDDQMDLSKIEDALHVNFNKQCMSLQGLATEYTGLVPEWSRFNTKFICIANVSHVSTSDMPTNELEPNFFHITQNKWLWNFLAASTAIRKHTRDEDVADIIFAPPAPAISSLLSSLWGEYTSVYGNRNPNKFLTVPQVFPLLHNFQ